MSAVISSADWLDAPQYNADGLIPAIAQDHASGRILMMAWMNKEALKLTAQTNTAVYFSRSRGQLWHKGETSGHTQIVHEIRLDCDADVIVLMVTQLGGIACHTGRASCFYQRLDTQSPTPTWQTVDAVLKNPHDIYGNNNHNDDNNHNNNHNDNHNDNQHTSSAIFNSQPATILIELDKQLHARKTADADDSYVASLYAKGINKILEKVGEEATETLIAAKDYAHHLSQTNTTNRLDKPTNASQVMTKNDLIYEIADLWFHTMVMLAWFNMDSSHVLTELARRFGLSGLTEKANRNNN